MKINNYCFSKYLAELRKSKGWFQADLANNTRISQVMAGKGTISKFDKKKSLMRIEEIEPLDNDGRKTSLMLLIRISGKLTKGRKAFAV